ncbi:glycoside hydrolase superfamily [Geopyxis carbonaria]|nr:glycoside hydrolase superfamily [Geopyxis carbonaria]
MPIFLLIIQCLFLLVDALPISSASYYPPERLGELAVYFGQNSLLPSESLSLHCSNPAIDIIVLGFVGTYFHDSDNLPSLNLGSTYCNQSPSASTGLLSCPALGAEITACQQAGKKILLSLGGQHTMQALPSDDAATALADNLWALFGSGTNPELASKRPFGNATVDGFDLDPENKAPGGYPRLISRLREHFASAPKKPHYLSAAPQCFRPETSLGPAVYDVDYLFVQMYNNPSCENSAASVRAWSEDVAAHNPNVKLFPGFLGAPAAGGSGYIEAPRMQELVAEVRGLANVKGVMVWDASYGGANVDVAGDSFLDAAKGALMA